MHSDLRLCSSVGGCYCFSSHPIPSECAALKDAKKWRRRESLFAMMDHLSPLESQNALWCQKGHACLDFTD